ncbi:nose resistant to fluoxetine protein 6 isoform X2 [Tetranychus urticae]|nr:nose resistant to fluoxetine protein 6 isoform X2 [Tetranychus urticae]
MFRGLVVLLIISSVDNLQILNDPGLVQQWISSADALDKLLWPQKDIVCQLVENITSNWDLPVSQQCLSDLHKIHNGLNQRKVWAYKFLESSAGNKPGFLRGYISDLGNYHECLSISHDFGSKYGLLSGQYCLLRVHLPLPFKPVQTNYDSINLNLNGTILEDSYYSMFAKQLKFFYNNTFNFGFCIPTSCSQNDFQTVTNRVFQGTRITPKVSSCEKNDITDGPRSIKYQETAMTILTMLTLLILGSTLVTHIYPDNVSPVLASFSIIENTKKLIPRDDDNDRPHDLAFIHCVRVSLRVFGLLGHIYLTLGVVPHTFPIFSYSLPQQWLVRETWKQMFIFIDIFFVMSGFLTVYTWYPKIKQLNGEISFYRYVTARFFRSTPLFLGILVLLFAFSGIGSGPIFSEFSDMIKGNCMKYWWTNLLYVSNWVKPSKMGYPNWWSISIDFQLYCLSYLPLKWLVINPRQGIISLIGLIGIGPLLTSLVAFIKRVPLLVCCTLDYDQETQFFEHFSTYTHIAPYFLGMLTGYLVVTNKEIENKLLIALGYIFSTIFWIGTFVLSYYFVDSHLDRFVEVAYIGLQKLVFSSFFAWLFYAASFKYGGSTSKYMVAKVFVPFSRLSYSIAMSEMLFIWYDITNSHQYFPADHYNEVILVSYIFLMCTALGFIVYLLFEAPSLNLIKIFIKPQTNISKVQIQRPEKID